MSIYTIIAIVFFAISAIFLAIGIALFVRLDIVSVIGDLSGKTAQKQISQIKSGRRMPPQSSEKSGKEEFDIFNIKGSVASNAPLNQSRKEEFKAGSYYNGASSIENSPVFSGAPNPRNSSDFMDRIQPPKRSTEVLNDVEESPALAWNAPYRGKGTGTGVLGDTALEAQGTEILSDTTLEAQGTEILSDTAQEAQGTEMLSDTVQEAQGTQVLSETVREDSAFEIILDQVQILTDESIN